MPRTQEAIRSVNMSQDRLWVMCDVPPHLPRALTQRHPWKQILGVWPPRSGAQPAPPGLAWWVGAGGWRADVGSGGPSRDTPSPGSLPGEGGGARLPGMGEEVCSDLASASPASRPQRRVWEDPKGSPKRVRVPDIYSLPGLRMRHQGRPVGAR